MRFRIYRSILHDYWYVEVKQGGRHVGSMGYFLTWDDALKAALRAAQDAK